MRLGTCLACLCGVAVLPAPAAAFLPLIDQDAELELLEARLVVAAQGARPTTWLDASLRVSGPRFFIVLPLTSRLRLDSADLDWFPAIDGATAPRVLPPPAALAGPCDVTREVESTEQEPGATPAEVSRLLVLSDADELSTFVAQENLKPRALPSDWLAHEGGFLGIEYRSVSGSQTRLLLRATDERAFSALLPHAQSLPAFGVLPLTLVTLGPVPEFVAADNALTPEDLRPVWSLLDQRSDYVQTRRQVIADSFGDVWVTEVVGQTPLYQDYYPDGQARVPSLVVEFKRRLELRGHSCPDWLTAVREGLELDESAPSVCPAGALSSGSDTACAAAADAARVFDCAGVNELSLALSGARLRKMMLVRQVGGLTRGWAEPTLVVDEGLPLHSVKVYASTLDTSECPELALPAGSLPPSVTPSTPVASSTGATSSAPQPTEPREQDPGPVETCVWRGVVVEGCSTSSQPTSDETTCAGDSSSDYDGGGDTCSGDTTPSSDSDGETCAGDSSGGSDDAGESCSGDASSDTAGDTACGASSESDSCRVGRRGFPRPRMSALSVLLSALLLPWRRRRRRRARGPEAHSRAPSPCHVRGRRAG